MAKQLHRDGFTLIESLLVLTIISLFLFITISHPKFNIFPNSMQYEVEKLTSKIDFYQSQAIKYRQPVLLVFRKSHNDIKVETFQPHHVSYIPLKPLQIKSDSNLNDIIFDKNGKTSKFGTLKFEYNHRQFSVIFHIEQRRYRVSFST